MSPRRKGLLGIIQARAFRYGFPMGGTCPYRSTNEAVQRGVPRLIGWEQPMESGRPRLGACFGSIAEYPLLKGLCCSHLERQGYLGAVNISPFSMYHLQQFRRPLCSSYFRYLLTAYYLTLFPRAESRQRDLRPHAGLVFLFGRDLGRSDAKLRSRCGPKTPPSPL